MSDVLNAVLRPLAELFTPKVPEVKQPNPPAVAAPSLATNRSLDTTVTGGSAAASGATPLANSRATQTGDFLSVAKQKLDDSAGLGF